MWYEKRSEEPVTLEEVKKHFRKTQLSIQSLLDKLGDEGEYENITFNRNDLDESFIRGEYFTLASKLEDINWMIGYLNKPVVDQGYISHNLSRRYKLPSGEYFTSGDRCEILFKNKRYDEEYWVCTTIEHNGEDYYATALGADVSIDGMMVRVRR